MLNGDSITRYDRQIRAWGFETQKKLQQSQIGFMGITPGSMDFAKNLILAGVGQADFYDEEGILTSNYVTYFGTLKHVFTPQALSISFFYLLKNSI